MKETFSIIVPTYGRPAQLEVCLQSLLCLDYPRMGFEVIVVDDGSDTAKAIVGRFCKVFDIKVIDQQHAGPAAARNTGAAHAKGRFLAFTDDDCMPASDWLKSLAARFAGEPNCAIGGRTLNALAQNRYSTASQLLIEYLYAYHNAQPDRAAFLTSNNLAMPADRFHAVGGFDGEWLRAAAEDRELCDRWLHHGNRIIYAPEALVYHAHPLTFRTFWRQHFNYGRGAFYFHRVRAWRGQTPFKIEPLRFYLGLLCFPAGQTHGWEMLLLAKLLWLAQVANAGGFLWESATRKNQKNAIHVGRKLRTRPLSSGKLPSQ